MRKFQKLGIFAILAALVVCSACAKETGTRNAYQVAVDMGYDGTMSEFLSGSLSTGATKERQLYEEAKEDGYEGSFFEFLKELGTEQDGIDEALRSVVSLACTFQSGKKVPSIFGDSSETFSAVGSGVIYSLNREEGDAYLITNYHVVYSPSSSGTEEVPHIADDIKVYLYGGELSTRAIEASYVGGAMEYDLAVLKIEDSEILKESSAAAAKLYDSDTIQVGQTVYAIGNPNAQGISATRGVVSVDAEYIDIDLADDSGTTNLLEIRTDAPINHGNSGGGLFTEGGGLVGIVNARTETTGVLGFGFAIPSKLVTAVVQNIIDNSGANSSRGALRAMLGITVQVGDTQSVYDEAAKRMYILETVTVKEVTLGSASFGKIKEGDVIVSVKVGERDAVVVSRMFMLTNELFNVRRGDKVQIVLSRGDETITIELDYSQNSDFKLLS